MGKPAVQWGPGAAEVGGGASCDPVGDDVQELLWFLKATLNFLSPNPLDRVINFLFLHLLPLNFLS